MKPERLYRLAHEVALSTATYPDYLLFSGSGVSLHTDGNKFFDTGGAPNLCIQLINQVPATGTLPTLDVRVEHSCDGEHWDMLADLPQIDGTVQSLMFSVPGAAGGSPNTFAQFIRLMAKVGGSGAVYYSDVRAYATLKG